MLRQQRDKPDLAAGLIDRGGLHRGNLVLAKALADDINAAAERSIVEGPVTLAGEWRAVGRDQGFFRVGELALGLGERHGDGANGVTGAVHRQPPGAQN